MKNNSVEHKCQDKVLLSVSRTDSNPIGIEFAKSVFGNMDILYWDPGDEWPAQVDDWEGDWIISYRGDFIFPEKIYSRARKGAINIHPSPPRYRGLGGQYYAIYHNEKTFGSTCHHMASSVDSGQIIDAAEFQIAPGATVSSLRQQVDIVSLEQFERLITSYISNGEPLPVPGIQWGERLFKLKELKAWMEDIRKAEPDHRCFK